MIALPLLYVCVYNSYHAMIVRTIQYALGVERIQSLNNFVYYKRYSMHTVVKKKKACNFGTSATEIQVFFFFITFRMPIKIFYNEDKF